MTTEINMRMDRPHPGWQRLLPDFLAIVTIVVLHPVIYYFGETRMYFPPDSISYLAFARDYLSQGILYFEGGIADTGIVLPPVYPILIFVSNFFVDDILVAGELVSRYAAILTSLVFYFLVRRWCNPYFAFVAVLPVQLNYEFVASALTPLTEACFILAIACLMWLACKFVDTKKQFSAAFLIGVILALTFLTRQVGIILVPFVLLMLLLVAPRRFVVNAVSVVLGMLLLILPYGAMLQDQSVELQAPLSMFDQHWTKRETIPISDLDSNLRAYVQNLHDQPVENYGGVILKRRLFRQLLPDSSAMLSDVRLEPTIDTHRGLRIRLQDIWLSIDQFDDQFASNVMFLAGSLGWPVLIVFVLLLITPFVFRMHRAEFLPRYFIGGFVLYYLTVLSILTGIVERYVLIMAPFILIYVAIETLRLLSLVKNRRFGGKPAFGVFTVSMAVLILAQSSDFRDTRTYEREQFAKSRVGRLERLQKILPPGSSVFSMYPVEAFLAGGTWRQLPNDTLEKISRFALQEGIDWVLVVQEAKSEVLYNRYSRAWYMDPNLASRFPRLMELHAISSDGKTMLFRFKYD